MKTRPGCWARNLSSSNSLKVRSRVRPRSLEVYVDSSIINSPLRISSGSASGAPSVSLTREQASLSRASTSAGDDESMRTSSIPQSHWIADRPPSVVTRMSGTFTPVWRRRRVSPRTAGRSRRPSTMRTSQSGALRRAVGSAGSVRTWWARRPRAGSTSVDGSIARVSRTIRMGASRVSLSRVASRRHGVPCDVTTMSEMTAPWSVDSLPAPTGRLDGRLPACSAFE